MGSKIEEVQKRVFLVRKSVYRYRNDVKMTKMIGPGDPYSPEVGNIKPLFLLLCFLLGMIFDTLNKLLLLRGYN